MRTFKSKLLLLVTAVAMCACLCFGLVACGGDKNFSAPANLKVEANVLTWDAADGAEAYTVKINEDETTTVNQASLDLNTVKTKLNAGENTLSVKVNATEKKGESEYSEALTYSYTPSQEDQEALNLYNAFKEALNGALSEVQKAESLDALNKKITAVTEAYNALNDAAKAYITSEENTSYNGLSSTASAWSAEIEEAKTEWNGISFGELSSDAAAEENIAAANAALTKYQAYKGYVKSQIPEAKLTEVNQALEAAQNKIKETVNPVKEAVDALTGVIAEENVTVEYYNLLNGYKNAVETFGAYANSLWSLELTQKLNNEITTLLGTVKVEKSEVVTFVDGATGTVTVLYAATNILGEQVKLAKEPVLSLTLDANSEVTASKFNFDDDRNVYVCTVSFLQKGDDSADYKLKVTYSVDGGSQQTVVYKTFNDDVYFNPDEFKAISDEGKIQFSGAPGDKAYFDIYKSADVSVAGTLPVISDFPLVKGIEVTNGMKIETLRSQLVKDYGDILLNKKYNVCFVVYKFTSDGDGISISNIKNALVSRDNYLLDLTEDDAKARLEYSEVGMTSADPTTGGIILGAGYNPAALAAQFNDPAVTEQNVKDQLCWIIDVTLNNQTKTFTMPCTGGSLDGAVLKRNIWNLFNNDTDNGYKLQIRLALKEDSGYSDILRESEKTSLKDWPLTVSAADARLPINLGATNGKLNATTEPTGTWAYGAWEVASTWNRDYHDGLTVLVYDASDISDVQNYDFVENDTPFAMFTHGEHSEISWTALNNAITEAWASSAESKLITTRKLVFVLRVLANENGIDAGYLDSVPVYANNESGERAVLTYNRDYTVPNGIQFKFVGAVFAFNETDLANSGNVNSRGEIFKNGVECIEIEFSNDTQIYSAYLFTDGTEDDSPLNLYASRDKQNTALSCDKLANGWMNVADFEAWAKTSYSLADDFTINGWSFRTKVIVDGSGYYVGEAQYSSSVTYNA